jgi:hypothetical protein
MEGFLLICGEITYGPVQTLHSRLSELHQQHHGLYPAYQSLTGLDNKSLIESNGLKFSDLPEEEPRYPFPSTETRGWRYGDHKRHTSQSPVLLENCLALLQIPFFTSLSYSYLSFWLDQNLYSQFQDGTDQTQS